LLEEAGKKLAAGDPQGAIKKMEEAVKAFPDDPQALAAIGAVWMTRGNPSKALEAFEKANAKGPFATVEQALAGVYMKQGLSGRGLEHAEKALRLAPELPLARMLATDALLLEGRLEEALTSGRKGVKDHPGDGGLLSALGDAAMASNQVQEAKTAYMEALKLQANNPRAALGLARFWLNQKSPKEAMGVLENTLKLMAHPDMEDMLAGLLLKDPVRHQESMAMALRAYKTNPSHPGYKHTLALTLLAHGQAAKATALLEEVVRQRPDALEGWMALSKAYSGQGDPQKARQILEDLLKNQDLELDDRLREEIMKRLEKFN
jgi:tetratricopeptide (TPR) repeat protein